MQGRTASVDTTQQVVEPVPQSVREHLAAGSTVPIRKRLENTGVRTCKRLTPNILRHSPDDGAPRPARYRYASCQVSARFTEPHASLDAFTNRRTLMRTTRIIRTTSLALGCFLAASPLF